MVKDSDNADEVHMECKTFLKMFTALYHASMVTPYMHIMVHHVPDLIRRHGELCKFNQQAVEKENHRVTSTFFTCTNFRSGSEHVMRKAGRRLLRF